MWSSEVVSNLYIGPIETKCLAWASQAAHGNKAGPCVRESSSHLGRAARCGRSDPGTACSPGCTWLRARRVGEVAARQPCAAAALRGQQPRVIVAIMIFDREQERAGGKQALGGRARPGRSLHVPSDSRGPSAGSYRPLGTGLFWLSNMMGELMRLTLSLRTCGARRRGLVSRQPVVGLGAPGKRGGAASGTGNPLLSNTPRRPCRS